MKRVICGVLILGLVVPFGMYSCKKREKYIKIGAIIPLTGYNAVYGIALKEGMDLALDEINSDGGINGQILKIIYEDSQADPQKGVNAFNKLQIVDKVPMVIGGMFSAVTLAIAPIAEKGKIVLISPTSSAVEITKAGNYIFRIYPSDSYDGAFLANFAIENLGAKTASIIHIQVASTLAISNVFKNVFEKKGRKILSMHGYNEGETDFRSYLLRIKDYHPNIIFIPGYLREMGLILKQAREIGLRETFLSISTFYDHQIFELAGNAAEGVIFSTPYFDPESPLPHIQKFVGNFKNKYAKVPNIWSGYGYDVVKIVALALSIAGEKSNEIKDSLYGIKDFLGVTGKTSFDKNGDVAKELRIMTVEGGRFVSYRK